MAASKGSFQTGSTRGRRVWITAVDGSGGPAGASIKVFFNGADAGLLDLGTGTRDPVSIEVSDPNCSIELVASYSGQTLRRELPPSLDHVTLRFSGVIRFAGPRRPLATCPDGTSGSPCVQCRDGTGRTWEMCC